MKNNYNKKKRAAVLVLSLAAVCLAGGVFYYVNTMGNSGLPALVAESEPSESEVAVSEIKPETSTVKESSESVESSRTEETTKVEESTKAEESTQAPGAESIAFKSSEPQTEAQSKPSDGKPKSPAAATPPAEPPKETESPAPVENPDESGTCQPDHTPQPETDQPQCGETQDGKIYVPGFGWVENKGGGSVVHEAPNAGTGKPIGDM